MAASVREPARPGDPGPRRPAVLAALKCHDLAGQDTIAIEPCTGGSRLVRRPYPEKLLSLHA